MVITSLAFFLAFLVDAAPALEQPVGSMLPKARIVTSKGTSCDSVSELVKRAL